MFALDVWSITILKFSKSTHLPSSCCKAATPLMIAGRLTRDRSSPRVTNVTRPVYVMARWPFANILLQWTATPSSNVMNVSVPWKPHLLQSPSERNAYRIKSKKSPVAIQHKNRIAELCWQAYPHLGESGGCISNRTYFFWLIHCNLRGLQEFRGQISKRRRC